MAQQWKRRATTWKHLKTEVKGSSVTVGQIMKKGDKSKAEGRKQTKKIPITFRCIKSDMMSKERLSFWNIKVNHEHLCIILHFIIKVISYYKNLKHRKARGRVKNCNSTNLEMNTIIYKKKICTCN